MEGKHFIWLGFLAVLIASCITIFSTANKIEKVEEAVQVGEKIYGLQKNDDYYSVFQTDLDGTHGVICFLKQAMSTNEYFDFVDFEVQGQNVVVTFEKCNLHDLTTREYVTYESYFPEIDVTETIIPIETNEIAFETIYSFSKDDLPGLAINVLIIFNILSFFYVLYQLFFSHFLTLTKIFVFLLIGTIGVIVVVNKEVLRMTVDQISHYEVQKLQLIVEFHEYGENTDYQALLDEIYQLQCQSMIDEVILPTEDGYQVFGKESAPRLDQEELDALDSVFTTKEMVQTTHDKQYHQDSFTTYIPLQNKEDEVVAILRNTYFYPTFSARAITAQIIAGLDNTLIIIVLATMIIASTFLVPLIFINRAIEKKGVYQAKRYGISEVGKLKEVLSDMSRGIQKELTNISQLERAHGSYIPPELIQLFGKEDICQLDLGDVVEVEKTALLIRTEDFLKVENRVDHNETFIFLSDLFQCVEPMVRQQGGFIGKCNNGNIMAFFEFGTPKAILCGNEILMELSKRNMQLGNQDVYYAASVIHAKVKLEIVGVPECKEIFMVSPEIEKGKIIADFGCQYRTGLLIDSPIIDSLSELENSQTIRYLGKVKNQIVYEDFSTQREELVRLKVLTKELFNQGVYQWLRKDYKVARDSFIRVLKQNNEDYMAALYFSECNDIVNQEEE